jgi:hypothetical protein
MQARTTCLLGKKSMLTLLQALARNAGDGQRVPSSALKLSGCLSDVQWGCVRVSVRELRCSVQKQRRDANPGALKFTAAIAQKVAERVS